MSIESGKYKDFVTIQINAGTTGDYGEVTDAWQDVAERPCEIFPIDAKEEYNANTEHNEIKYRVKFRYERTLIQGRNRHYRLINKRVSPLQVLDVEGVINVRNENKEFLFKCTERF